MPSGASRIPPVAECDGVAARKESLERTRRSFLAKAGLVAGGVGAIVLHGAEQALAQSMGETIEIAPPPGQAALKLSPSGSVPPSVSAGGAVNLDNTPSTGAGAVLYSNQGAGALGRLLVVNQANPANPQQAVRIQNAGTAHTVSIFHDPAGGAGNSSAEALDIVSTNPLDTTLGVEGQEEGRGTVKITHAKPARYDGNASAISIALLGAGTACQGIFIGNDYGNRTTGSLLHIRNGGPGSERLLLTADGRVELPVRGPVGGLVIGSDANLYRVAPNTLATDGAIRAGLAGVSGSVADDTFASFQHQIRLDPLAAGTASLARIFGLYSPPSNSVGRGWNVTNYAAVRIEPPAGEGTITHLTGIEIRAFKARGANNYSLRSLGNGTQMRHSGAVSLGSQAPADTLLHVRGNPSAHGSLTLEAESSDPPAPVAGKQARLYIKNNTLVIQWHDGAKALYTTIPLESPGPYPARPSVTTDTAAP